MRTSRKRYFIGVALSGHEKEAVDALRERIAAEFGVGEALRSPPHITLFYPFESGDATALEKAIRQLNGSLAPVRVSIKKFGAFDRAVWFLDPAQDPVFHSLKERVVAIVKETVGIEEKTARRKTHFHITLAYKDVEQETHRRIGEFLRSEPLPLDSITVDNVTIFRRRPDDSGWDPMN